MHDKEILQY